MSAILQMDKGICGALYDTISGTSWGNTQVWRCERVCAGSPHILQTYLSKGLETFAQRDGREGEILLLNLMDVKVDSQIRRAFLDGTAMHPKPTQADYVLCGTWKADGKETLEALLIPANVAAAKFARMPN